MNRIAAAILAGAVLIAGSILWTAPRARPAATPPERITHKPPERAVAPRKRP